MTYRRLTDLATAVRASGLRVVEISGWQTRGRPSSTGSFNPKGVLCHHTGSSEDGRKYADWLAKVGRSDLPAPLCHLSLDREGTVYVIAAGRANHAGKAKASGPMPAGDGNALYVGIEAQNTGSEGWGHKGTDAHGKTITQREAYERLCAALCRHYGWPASHVRAHRETSVTGKWDPGRMDMNEHRAAVAGWIKNDGEDEDMAVLSEKIESNVEALHGHSVEFVLVSTFLKTEAIQKALTALAAGISPTVEKAVQDALADAVVNVDVNVKGAGA